MERPMKKFGVLAAVAGVALSGAAAAQDGAETNGDGIYVRVGAGASFVGDLEQDLTRFSQVSCDAIGCNPDRQLVDLDAGFTASGALGFNYTEGIRTELEYRYVTSGVSSRRLFEGGGDVGEGIGVPAPSNDDVNAHFVFSNFYFDLNNSSRFTPFIGGGVGGAFVENEFGLRDAALAYQGRAGVAYDFGGGLSFDLEYIYLRTNDLSFGPDDGDFAADGPPAVRLDEEHYQSSSAMISIRKQF